MIIYNDKVFNPYDSSTFEQFTEEEFKIVLRKEISSQFINNNCFRKKDGRLCTLDDEEGELNIFLPTLFSKELKQKHANKI